MRPLSLAPAVLALLAAAPLADTLVVDRANGPGTDFTNLQAAIDAAAPGDLLLVRTGSYAAFDLDVGVTILGESFVDVAAGSTVADLPGGEVAVLSHLFLGPMDVLGCEGTVVLDTVNLLANGPVQGPGDAWVLEVEGSADVRLRQFGVNPSNGSGRGGVRVAGSRLEADGGVFDGARGVAGTAGSPDGGDGGIGLSCEPGSDVHVAFSRMRGGNGGAALFQPGAGHVGGDGGVGLLVASGAVLRFDGTFENEVDGGQGGAGGEGLFGDCGLFGASGTAVQVGTASDPGGSARISAAVRLEGGGHFCRGDGLDSEVFGGTLERPPLLAAIHTEGDPVFDPDLRFETSGQPGHLVVLVLGVEPGLVDVGLDAPGLVVPAVTMFRGALGPSGEDVFQTIPDPSLPVGLLVLAQSIVIEPDLSAIHPSNSSSLVLF